MTSRIASHAAATRSTGSTVELLAGGALVLVTVLAYLPALQGGFVWDDDAYVSGNRTLRTLDGLRRIWLEPGAVPQYYPLTFTSFWLEYAAFGTSAAHHLVNVLLHGLNAVLVWRILRRLALPGAWLAAAVFALHPVHVESVAWITERKNVLSGTFYLSALLVWVRLAGLEPRPADPPGRGAWGLVAGLFLGALLAKTVTASLPVIVLVLIWWRRGTLTAREIATAVPFVLVGAALGSVTAWMERTHVGATGALFDLSPAERVLIAGRALWFQVASLVWPRNLTFVYPRWVLDPGVWWQWFFPLAAIALGVGLVLARDRIGRGAAAAAACFTVTLVPALGFVDVYPMRYTFVADHYQYLASLALIAPAAALAAMAAGASTRMPIPAAALAGVLLALLGTLTWRQATVYRNAETLWRDTLAKNPTAGMAHVNLGMLMVGEGRGEEAIAEFEAALRLDPADAEVLENLGVALAGLGRHDEAREALEEALRLAPARAQVHSNLGNLAATTGRTDEAFARYREAVRLDPAYADPHNNLGNLLAAAGRADEAIAEYEAALAIDPTYASAHANLAAVLGRLGRSDEALVHLRAAVDADPRRAESQRALGVALASRGELALAVPHLAEAARLRPDDARAHYELGAALTGAGRTTGAVAAYERAAALAPADADVQNDLGIALAKVGRTDEAITHFRAAVRLAPDHQEAARNLAAVLARTGGGQP